MKIDCVYTTYRKDLHWASYSLQLLHKHLRGAFGVKVIANEDCEPVCSEWRLPRTKFIYVKPWPDNYAFKMYLTTTADQHSDADLIMLLDSDHILMEPFHIDDLLMHGLPIIRYFNWGDDPNDTNLTVGQKVWGPPTERALGVELDRCYMVAPPFVFWHDTFAKLRIRVEQIIGLPFEKAVYSDVPYNFKNFLKHPKVFCDYESLGLFASKFQPGRYVLQHHQRLVYWPWRVFWSHGDWTPTLQARFDKLLAQ